MGWCVAEASLPHAARQLGFQGVQMRGPEAPEPVKPLVHVLKGLGLYGVEAAGAVGADGGEARVAEHAQVRGDAWLGDAKIALDVLGQRACWQLAVGEEFEDAAANGIAQDVKRLHMA